MEFTYSAGSRPSARIERRVLQLQPYSFSVKYLPGSMNNEDTLTRLTKTEKPQPRNVAEEYIRFVTNTAVPQAMTTEEIEEKSAVDKELKDVRQIIN